MIERGLLTGTGRHRRRHPAGDEAQAGGPPQALTQTDIAPPRHHPDAHRRNLGGGANVRARSRPLR